MIYIDTSVLVALCVNEPKSNAATRWYNNCTDGLTCAIWCVTEFASALGIKQRTNQINALQAQEAWQLFERLCANDVQLFPVEPGTFHRAAILILDAETGLRAGDALHLAAALDAKTTHMATLDETLAKNAKQMKMKLVTI
jgi:predicted nucleic acid-binding protein